MSRRQITANTNRARRNGKTRNKAPYSEARPLITRDSEKDVQQSQYAGLQRNLRVPHPFPMSPVQFRKFRFITNAAIASTTWQFADLIRLMCFSTAANTGYSKLACVALHYVELWEPYQGTGTLTSLAGIEYEGSGGTNTGINLQYFGSSVSPDSPTHIFAPYPKKTLIGWWQQKTSSSSAFTLKNLDTGTVIDIAMSYILSDTDTVASLGPFAIIAASAGLTGIHPPATTYVGIGVNNM